MKNLIIIICLVLFLSLTSFVSARTITVDDDNLVQFEYGIDNIAVGNNYQSFFVDGVTLEAGVEYKLTGKLKQVWVFWTDLDDYKWEHKVDFHNHTYYSFFPDSIVEVN